MDDNQIRRLVQMALEAQALESPESSADAYLIAAHRTRWRPLRWCAAAAILVLGAGAWLATRPPAGPSHVPGNRLAGAGTGVPAPPVTAPRAPVVVAAATPEPAQHSVVLTIFRDSWGDLACVQWRPHEWGEKSLAELTPTELIDAGANVWCDSAASEMVVVAVSGPAGAVPATDVLAQDLAACIATSDDLCEYEPGTYASVTLSCLPPGVEAVAQSVPLGLN